MSKSIEVKWEVSDGYIGGDRPQYSSIYLDDISPDSTDEEIVQYIYESVQEDFEQKCHPEVRNMDDVIEQIRAHFKK